MRGFVWNGRKQCLFSLLVASLLYLGVTKATGNEHNSKTDSNNDDSLLKDIPQINEKIWKAINNYDNKLRHKTKARKTGYSKNNPYSRGMAARNWIVDDVMRLLGTTFVSNEKTIGLISDQIHGALAQHQEKRDVGVDGPFEVSPDARCDAAHALKVNEPEYFVHHKDPCGSSTDADVDDHCASSREYKLFRTHNGECNNPSQNRWGSSFSPLARLLPLEPNKLDRQTHDQVLSNDTQTSRCNGIDVDWSDIKNWACCTRDNPCTVGGGDCDGHYECEGNLKCGVNNCWRDFSGNDANWDPTVDCCYDPLAPRTSSSRSLPNARLASSILHPDSDVPDNDVNLILMQFGQFLDHDISLSPEHENFDCCNNPPVGDPKHDPECMPISIPRNDPFYSQFNENCMELTRSVPHCSQPGGSREQFNILTSFLDASNVYGSDEYQGRADIKLRSYIRGKLREGPEEGSLPREGHCQVPIGGDIRVSEMAGLATMHTLFLREHNRVCDLLWDLPIKWFELGEKGCVRDECDELIYQNARRIVNAEWQNIIYSEFLPIVIGHSTMNKYTLHLHPSVPSSFKRTTNPNILSSFSTAAYRFGHTLIQGVIQKRNMDSTQNKTYSLSDTFFKTVEFVGDGADQIISGMVQQPIQSRDRFISSEVSQKLFKEDKVFGKDLIALNIQRGRDHGIPSYSEFYKHLGPLDDPNRNMNDWNQRPRSFSVDNWNRFKSVYKHPQDIELFPGGIMEEKTSNDGLLGTVFREIIALQFKRLKDGDRFFFTHGATGHDHEFNSYAREHIMTRKFSDIICDNTNIQQVPSDAFRGQTSTSGNPMKRCSSSSQRNDLNVGAINLLSIFCDGAIPGADWQCCSSAHPCKEGQGDCDQNSDCMPGLQCGVNNCKNEFPTDSSTWHSTADCCFKP